MRVSSTERKSTLQCNFSIISTAISTTTWWVPKLTLYFNKDARGKWPRHHPATIVRLAKQPFQQDQSGPEHALRNPDSPRVQLRIHRQWSSVQFGSIEKVWSQPWKSIKSTTGLTAWQQKRVQAPFSPPASIWTLSSMELNGSLPLGGKQMAVSRNQQKWATTRFSQHTHIRNHKGTSQKPVILKKLTAKDVKYGYSLPVPLSSVQLIPGLVMAPMNIMEQNTIDKFGQINQKTDLLMTRVGNGPQALL